MPRNCTHKLTVFLDQDLEGEAKKLITIKPMLKNRAIKQKIKRHST